jgi:predicted amidohydrolase YtcJ
VSGTFVTMDWMVPVAQAFAVRDRRLLEVGGAGEIPGLRENDYEQLSL